MDESESSKSLTVWTTASLNAVSPLAATVGAPVQIWFQGAAPAQPNLGFPWRPAVRSSGSSTGLDEDVVAAFRFRIVVDRGFANTVVVTGVRVVYEF